MTTLKSSFLALICLGVIACSCDAFVVPQSASKAPSTTAFVGAGNKHRFRTGGTPLFDFLGPKERDSLTRDNEPEEFFQT